MNRNVIVAAIAMGLMVAVLPDGLGCGVNWGVPSDHFDGVSELGFVSYWAKMADLDLGNGLLFPLTYGFQSDLQRPSPYLGYGWVFPLLDANVVQTSENTFEVMKPGGYTTEFRRDAKNPSLLEGIRDWRGEIKGDIIKIWAPCGWSVTYTKGKITAIGAPKDQTISINRDSSGNAVDVTTGARVLLKVKRDSAGVVSGFEVGDHTIGLQQVEKPRIQSILGRNVVAAKDKSLGKVSMTGGEIEYEYSVNDLIQPTVTIKSQGEEPRKITWDPLSKFVISDANWTYNFAPPEASGSNLAIGRINAKGQKEFWRIDSARGEETESSVGGYSKITKRFVSGIFAGKIREICKKRPNLPDLTIVFSYSETGELIREAYRLGDGKFESVKDEIKQFPDIIDKGIAADNVWIKVAGKDGNVSKYSYHQLSDGINIGGVQPEKNH